MRSSLIPAEVTSFEDKLLAGLTLPQLGFIVSPLLLIGFLIIALPPFVTYVPYKLAIGLAIGAPLVAQAIRIDGQVFYKTFSTWLNYIRRPKIYVPLPKVAQGELKAEEGRKSEEQEIKDLSLAFPVITSDRTKLTVEMERDF